MRIKHKRKSSESRRLMCGICADRKPLKKSFVIKGCNHSYCSYCIRHYVTSKAQENVTRISCPVPDCSGGLDREECQSILPSKVFNKWEDAVLEAVVPDCDKFYCPFKDCSALLVKGHDFNEIVKSECPICLKLFCAKCEVPWHSRIKCREYQKLHKDESEKEDIMLMQLAKEMGWARCSECKIYVEKIGGCSVMDCRCGGVFCYSCGTDLNAKRECKAFCCKCGAQLEVDAFCYQCGSAPKADDAFCNKCRTVQEADVCARLQGIKRAKH